MGDLIQLNQTVTLVAPDPKLIATLKMLLAAAEIGKLRALVWGGVMADGSLGCDYDQCGVHPTNIVAAVELLRAVVVRDCIKTFGL